MTREEAIKILQNPPRAYDEKMWQALQMAIEALQAKTDGDLISRQDAIDAINHICPVDTEYGCTLLDRVDVKCVLSDLPSAESKTGEWIENVVRWGNAITTVHGYKCSECGALNLCKDKFCPNCGIRMRVEGNK